MQLRRIFSAAAALFVACAISAPVRADDLAYFENQLKPFLQRPKFIAPGPPFDARACMKGKAIFSMPVSSANPFTANIEKSMTAIAAKIGFRFTVWENQGQIGQWVQGMNAALTEKPNLIDLMGGQDPRQLVPQVRAALAAGIPVIVTHSSGLEQTPMLQKMGVDDVAFDFYKAGALLVDWAALHTKGKLDAIVVISTGSLATEAMVPGIESELKHCPKCKTNVINTPVTDWSTRITPSVQATLLSHPNVNYIIPIYDSMSQFVVPAVTMTNSADRVKIATFNGTPFVLGLVQQGKVEMDIGENLDWIGHAVIDAEMRIVCHLPKVHDEHIPMYIFDSHNAADAGTPPQLSKGYGNAYVEGYDKLWELK